MALSDSVKRFAVDRTLDFALKDPRKNLPRLMRAVDIFEGPDTPRTFGSQRAMIRGVINDPTNNMHQFMMRVIEETDHDQLKTVFSNFFMNAILNGWNRQNDLRDKYQCNIPWAILLDPTSACNKHCVGCWAAEYGHSLNLSFEDIDSIITQGKQLGVYLYIYTGGEPLVRKDDIIRICEKHDDCVFLSFTNGSLLDDKFADEMLRVKNFVPAFSLEGDREATDKRRGEGSYDEVVAAINRLRARHLLFGFSCCYTSENMDSITSEEFFDQMVDWGAMFVWYFHYMPVGVNAEPQLMPNPEQREKIYHRIRTYRKTKPLFGMDFQNDGQYVKGCVAGGRRYLHINANGDVEPCVFIHYSDSNIHEKTLIEALQGPLFMAYHDGQPFNENHLRPCPMLENPEKLRKIVHDTGASSTDLEAREEVDHLCDKTVEYAKNWKPKADDLWAKYPPWWAKADESKVIEQQQSPYDMDPSKDRPCSSCVLARFCRRNREDCRGITTRDLVGFGTGALAGIIGLSAVLGLRHKNRS
jgi:MoaA/NifB/PqqE/SkfB family radical SAM enzyme